LREYCSARGLVLIAGREQKCKNGKKIDISREKISAALYSFLCSSSTFFYADMIPFYPVLFLFRVEQA